MQSVLRVLIAACLCLVLMPSTAGAQAALDLTATARYFVAHTPAPRETRLLRAWAADQAVVRKPSLLGGAYGLESSFTRNSDDTDRWVIDAGNTVIEHLRFHVVAPDGSRQLFENGYWSEHAFLLHYGERLQLTQAGQYRVYIEFSGPYFRSYPQFKLWRERDYLHHVAFRNVVALGCLGTLIALAAFNLFMFASVRDPSQLHYATYLLAYALGWGAVLNLPASFTEVQWPLGWNYLPFFLLPICNTLFYLHFLKLEAHHPRLASWSRINFVLPTVLLPSCFIAPAYAHSLATITITVWLVLALASGIACMRDGYRPARYFVLAFCALIVPACLILPANLGLVPDFVDSELFTLAGGTLDALLLAFALADRLRLALQQKELYLDQLNLALNLANTDSLTGAGSRHAFDEYLKNGFDYEVPASDSEPILALIDLDGLKAVNEQQGYTAGDRLLQHVAQTLHAQLGGRGQVFRLGGDEFAITASAREKDLIETTLHNLEARFADGNLDTLSINTGFAYSHEAASPAILVTLADTRMYLAKSGRRKRQLRLA